MKQPVVVKHTRIGEGTPKICVPIVEKDPDSILAAARNLIEMVTAPLDKIRAG